MAAANQASAATKRVKKSPVAAAAALAAGSEWTAAGQSVRVKYPCFVDVKAPADTPSRQATLGYHQVEEGRHLVFWDTSIATHSITILNVVGKGPYLRENRALTPGGTWRVVPEEELSLEEQAILATERGALEWSNLRFHDTVGCDPEIFAVDATGKMVPAFEFLGPKAAGMGVYWDGYQAEFDTEPHACMESESSAITGRLAVLQSVLPKGCRLSMKNTWDIPEEWLKSHSPEYTQFGCSPSRNAYDEKCEIPDGSKVTTRSAGGHLHLSLPRDMRTDKGVAAVTRALDAVLGVLSVPIFRYWDTPQRRQYYGRAGEHRKTPYGVEYRVLSNAWLAHPVLYHLVFELARRCILLPSNGKDLLAQWMKNTTTDEVRNCINNCDVALALEIIQRNRPMFDALGTSLPCGKDWLTRLVFDGAHIFMLAPDELSSTWTKGGNEAYDLTSLSRRTTFYK